MEIKGYKAFASGLKNKYGADFEIGATYSKNPDTLKFGEHGHGYHMTTKLADTFRFFNPCRDNVYCEVVGFGEIIKEEDYLYDSDVMYAVEKIKIVNVLSRADIFRYACDADIDEFRRLLALFPFTKEELKILHDVAICKGIEYQKLYDSNLLHQTGDVLTFKRDRKYLRQI